MSERATAKKEELARRNQESPSSSLPRDEEAKSQRKSLVEQAREIHNISSHAISVLETQVIGKVLQTVTGEEHTYEVPKPEPLTPYQQQMQIWTIERAKTLKGRMSTLQTKVLELQNAAKGQKGANKSKKPQSIQIEVREEDPERAEVVGLDDALIELGLQAKFLSKQGVSSSRAAQFGLQSLLSAKGGTQQYPSLEPAEENQVQGHVAMANTEVRWSIKDGKDLIALAYGVQQPNVMTSSADQAMSLEAQSSFSSMSMAVFGKSMTQMPVVSTAEVQSGLINEEDELEETSSFESGSEEGPALGVSLVPLSESEGALQGDAGQQTSKSQKSLHRVIREMQVIEEDVDRVSEPSHHEQSSKEEEQATQDHLQSSSHFQAPDIKQRGEILHQPTIEMNDLSARSRFSKKKHLSLEKAGQTAQDQQLPNSSQSPRQKRKAAMSRSQTIQVEIKNSRLDTYGSEEESARVIRRMEQHSRSHLNLNYVQQLLRIPRRERKKDQQATLVKYLRNIKVFKDLLIRGDKGLAQGQEPASVDESEETASFENLASFIRVLDVNEPGRILMEEGDKGELFYIILQGECEVQKASPVVIHNLTHREAIQDRLPFYFSAFLSNYEHIFWAGMDLTRQEADEMLGVVRESAEDGSSPVRRLPEWPVSKEKQLMLKAYVRRHEKEAAFRNEDNQPLLFVNKHLINLRQGAGFGELALMSDIVRMASVRTQTPCVLATLTRKDFLNVMQRAQKRKMVQQVGFLKRFSLFQKLSNMKLQKLFYLLKESELPKGAVLFRQRDRPIGGVYLVKEGEVAYEIKHEVVRPDYSQNSWLAPALLHNQLDRSSQRREIALFTHNEIVGFEEILRKRMLKLLKQEFLEGEGNDYFKDRLDKTNELFDDATLDYRNFTCVVKSSKAKLFFLPRDHLENFLRYLPNNKMLDEVAKRMQFLQRQIDTIMKVTKIEYDERQKLSLAKKFITRSLKYQKEELPATRRDELKQDVKRSLKETRDQYQSALKLDHSSIDHSSLSPSLLQHSHSRQSLVASQSATADALPTLTESAKKYSLRASEPASQLIRIKLEDQVENQEAGEHVLNTGPQTRMRSSLYSITEPYGAEPQAEAFKPNVVGQEKGSPVFQGLSFVQANLSSVQSNNSMRKAVPTEPDAKIGLDLRHHVETQRVQSRIGQCEQETTDLLQSARKKLHHGVQAAQYESRANLRAQHDVVQAQLQHHQSEASFLPSLRRPNLKYEDPYGEQKRNFPTLVASAQSISGNQSVRIGGLQNNRRRLQLSLRSGSKSPATSLDRFSRFGGQRSKEFAIKSGQSSLERNGSNSSRIQSTDIKLNKESRAPSQMQRKDIAAKIFISEEDLEGRFKDDLIQSDFIRFPHCHGTEAQQYSLAGFSKASLSSKKQIGSMRRAEQNAYERKHSSYRDKIEQSSALLGYSHSSHSALTAADQALVDKRVSQNRKSVTVEQTHSQSRLTERSIKRVEVPTRSDSSQIDSKLIEQAIEVDDEAFTSRMMEVLDGIVKPTFDPVANKERIERMQDKMSAVCDDMANKKYGSYRKSDNALLDKNALGPVYYNIQRHRRTKGLDTKYVRGKLVHQSTTHSNLGGEPTGASTGSGLSGLGGNNSLICDFKSVRSMARHSSSYSLKKTLKEQVATSIDSESMKIKSILTEKSPPKARLAQKDGPDMKYSLNPRLKASKSTHQYRVMPNATDQDLDRQDSIAQQASFLQPRLHLQEEEPQYEATSQLVFNKNYQLREKLLSAKRKERQERRRSAEKKREQHQTLMRQTRSQKSTEKLLLGLIKEGSSNQVIVKAGSLSKRNLDSDLLQFKGKTDQWQNTGAERPSKMTVQLGRGSSMFESQEPPRFPGITQNSQIDTISLQEAPLTSARLQNN